MTMTNPWVKISRQELEEAPTVRWHLAVLHMCMLIGFCIDQDGYMVSMPHWETGGVMYRWRSTNQELAQYAWMPGCEPAR